MNLQVMYVMKSFHWLFFAFSFLKEHKLHMHLGPSHFSNYWVFNRLDLFWA